MFHYTRTKTTGFLILQLFFVVFFLYWLFFCKVYFFLLSLNCLDYIIWIVSTLPLLMLYRCCIDELVPNVWYVLFAGQNHPHLNPALHPHHAAMSHWYHNGGSVHHHQGFVSGPPPPAPPPAAASYHHHMTSLSAAAGLGLASNGMVSCNNIYLLSI